jgi:hypothetical protein
VVYTPSQYPRSDAFEAISSMGIGWHPPGPTTRGSGETVLLILEACKPRQHVKYSVLSVHPVPVPQERCIRGY